MRLLKVVVMAIIMTLIGWVSGYQVGKRSADKWWQVHGPTYDYPAYGHQTLKWEANPIPYDGNLSKARQYFNCSYIHDRTITCTLFNDPGPDDIIEAFVHKKGDKMEMYIIDYYPPDGTIMSTTPPVKDKVDPTIPYTKPDTTCVKAGECQPTNYWTICDDGYVRLGKAIVDDDLKVKACGLHGAVDTRRIHISSTEGKDWKVIVTPINPKLPKPIPLGPLTLH